jgi:pectinesterase
LPASSTNFLTIQSAIDSIPAANITPYDIQIAAGTYAERITIPTGKEFVTLDGRGAVTIQMGSDLTHVAIVQAQANNFTMENITVNDTSGQNGPDNALLSTGDRQTYLNCSFLGYQDTLFANASFARQYFKNCTISGSVDFIYGAATCVFDTCNITQRVGGVSLTAPATPQTAAYGLVFINSHLINGGSVSAGSTALARAWNAPYGESAYIHTNMDNMISTVGWTNFSGTPQYVSTERYIEYGSSGAGAAGYLASPSQRASQAQNLTSTQAAQYANLTTWVPNFANLFNGWDPTALVGDAPVIYTGSNGVWETASNWNTGTVPSAGQPVYIRSGTLMLASNDSIDSLTLGTSAGGATFTISSGKSLSVGGQLSTTGTSGSPTTLYDIGGLSAGSITVNNTADAIHVQSNAAFSVSQGLTGAWPAGTLYVDQGTLHVPALGRYAGGPIVNLGAVAGSTGTWNIATGDVQYPQSIKTGAGTANITMTGGTINGTYGPDFGGGSSSSGGTATMTLSGGTFYNLNMNLGSKSGTYTFNQTGGTFQTNASSTSNGYDWLVADASGATTTWNLSGASSVVSLNDLFMGKNGNGTINQSGGAVTINQTDTNNLTSHSGLKLGWNSNGRGTYAISGGTLAIQNGGVTLGYDPTSGSSYGIGTLQVLGGAAGTINVTGNYSQSSKSVLDEHAQSNGMSTIAITGNVSFASGATIKLTADPAATPGTYTLMTWTGTRTGTPTLAAGVDTTRWSLSVNANSITATLVPLSVINGTIGNDTIRLVRNGTSLDVFINNATSTPDYDVPFASEGAITVNGLGGNDSVTVDFSGGATPVPAAGLTVDGGTGTDSLTIIGTAGADSASVDASHVTFNGSVITYANIESIIDNPGSGSDTLTQSAQPANSATLSMVSPTSSDSLNVSAGTFAWPAPAAGSGIIPVMLGTASIGSGAMMTLGTASSHADRTVLVANTLSIAGSSGAWTGTLDLGGNDAIVHNGDVASLTSQLLSGFVGASGEWTGTGIVSSAATNDSRGIMAVGVRTQSSSFTSFDGQTLSAGDVAMKETFFGDADLSGSVNAADYSAIDNGYAMNLTGWSNGDFNYDGVVNAADYSLIDTAFALQSTPGGPVAPLSVSATISNPSRAARPTNPVAVSVVGQLFSNTPVQLASSQPTIAEGLSTDFDMLKTS